MAVATPASLAAFRGGDRVDVAVALATIAGVAATAIHPAGLAVGGGLVGLLAPTLPRAFALGIGVGLTALLAWSVVLAWVGTLVAVATAAPLVYIALGAGLGVPALSAVAVRGLV